jgi:putative DNA primase/helicase
MRPDLAPEHRIFQRGGVVVRIATLPSPGFRGGVVYSEDGIGRPEGAVVISPVDRVYVQDILGRLGSFQRYDARQKDFKKVDVPKSIAETLLARKGLWPYPSLRGVILCPTVRADGSLLEAEGYDPASGFYLASSMKITVPESPTKEQAVEALGYLSGLLVNFSFVSEVDQAVVLALILTGIVRPAVENVPLFTITAPVRGSGKSTLVDIAAVLATGRRAAVVAAVRDQEELRKRLESSMLAGDMMVSLDNLNGTLNSDLLCQATTQASVKIRPLGVSQQQEVPNAIVFAANGNNLTIAGDLSRRTLQCKLDPNCERPEEREFEFDPVALATARREGYVSAVLIILKGYVSAGRPSMGLSRFGSFEPWSDLVRCALVWTGAADPCESRKEIISDDPELANLEALLAAWYETFRDDPMSVQGVVELTKEDESCVELAECIATVASDRRGKINNQAFGFWLKRNAGRIAGGLRVLRLPGAIARWRVEAA